MTESEESDPEAVYQSDEEVTCIMYQPSSSSSSEDLDTDVKDVSSYPPISVSPSVINMTGGFHIYPESVKSHIATNFPDISQRLHMLGTGSVGCIYLALSFALDWTISGKIPNNILCDACVLSPTRSVLFLTFKRKAEKDKSLQYNAKLSRHLITSVRKGFFPSFTVVSGVVDINDCRTDETFRDQIKRLDTEAKTSSIPQWLHMDKTKYDQLLDFFSKMVPTLDRNDVVKQRRQSEENGLLYSPSLHLPRTPPLNRVIVCENCGSRSERRDEKLGKITGELQRLTTLLMETAKRVRDLSEKVDEIRSENGHRDVRNRFTMSVHGYDENAQTSRNFVDKADFSSKFRKQSEYPISSVQNKKVVGEMVYRRPDAPPPYEEALRRRNILKGASKEIMLWSLELAVQSKLGQKTNEGGPMKTTCQNHMDEQESVESLHEKVMNLTDNQKIRRTQSDSSKSPQSDPNEKTTHVKKSVSFC